MPSNTVILFGAGATKACGGPLTNEILPQALDPAMRGAIEREDFLDLLDRFLVENFHVPQQVAGRTESDYPALPLLLSLVDTAIDRNDPMGPAWNGQPAQDSRLAELVLLSGLQPARPRGFSIREDV